MKDGKQADAMFLIIYLTSEQQSEWNAPPPSSSSYCLFLLGSMRLHCFPHDIIFCPGLCLLATVHANQKLWFMHLSCGGLDIKFNFAAVEGVPAPRSASTRCTGARGRPRGNSLLPPQYAKATFEWNICLVSEQSSVHSPRADTWKRGGEGRAPAPDCNKAASLVMVAHWNEACWMWVAEQSVSLVSITAL